MIEAAGGGCRTIFIGAVEEGRRCLTALLEGGEPIAGAVTLKEEWAAQTSGAVPFDDLAERYRFPLLKVRDLNHPANVRRLREMRPDLILAIGWTRLLGREVLSMPRRGCIGFHASLLPRYRGRAPVNWAIINGERETGNSMIFLDEGVDTGDVVAQRRIEITYEDTCATLYEKVADSAIDMLREHLPALKAGTAPRARQDDALATVMPQRRPEDGLIDWSKGSRALYDWVRALTHPYPGAFSFAGGRRILVWEARERESARRGAPGEVLAVLPGEGVEVATGDGSLLLGRIQPEGDAEERADGAAGRAGLRPGARLTAGPGGGAA